MSPDNDPNNEVTGTQTDVSATTEGVAPPPVTPVKRAVWPWVVGVVGLLFLGTFLVNLVSAPGGPLQLGSLKSITQDESITPSPGVAVAPDSTVTSSGEGNVIPHSGYNSQQSAEEPASTEIDDGVAKDMAGRKMSGSGGSVSEGISPLPPDIAPGGSVGGDRIIKNGSMTLKVKKGSFSASFDKVMSITRGYGGYVTASNISAVEKQPENGSLTVRVPSNRFEQLLSSLRKIGTVQNLSVDSQDVSQEFVDLKSRLRSWKAQQTVMLTLMAQAKTINQSIVIQEQLRSIQEQIELITGRLRYLEDMTSYSSLQVTLTESDKKEPTEPIEGEWGTDEALERAAHAFVDTVNVTIIAVGFLAPWGIIAVIIALVVRYRRRRRAEAEKTAADRNTTT